MSFGPAMVNDVVHTPELRGARLMLHDVNAERLQRAYQFAAKLNASAGAPVVLDYSTDPGEALDGADFVLSSAEFGRFEFWKQDFEIPNRYGARQINGENGGPGAVFHSLRSIKNTLSICESIEKYSPDAFLINLTNPMSRVTLAINRATSVRNVGMCHEMPMGIDRLARRLRVPRKHIEAKASGINHFTFFTEFRDRRTGEDLLPRVRAFFAKPVFDYSPRTVRVGEGHRSRRCPARRSSSSTTRRSSCTWCASTDSCPVRSTATSASTCRSPSTSPSGMPTPLDFHEPIMVFLERAASWAATTKVPLPLHLAGHSHEEVVTIIAAMWTDTPTWIMATNVPNQGYLPDVADGAIVEVGATVDGNGIHPDQMPPLGEPLAGWVDTQTSLQDLVVESAHHREPRPRAAGRRSRTRAHRPTRPRAGRCSTSSVRSRRHICRSDPEVPP